MTVIHENSDKATINEVNSIFQQPYWLDAVAPGQWGAATVEKDGKVVARLPYAIEKKYAFTALTMPQLTRDFGPWLAPSTAKYARTLAQQKDLMEALIEQLPPHDYFSQNFHPSINNWLPFYWRGFTQSTRYTYILEDLSDTAALWSGLMENIRREIRKAEKQLEVRDDLGVERLIDLHVLTYQRQGRAALYKRDYVHHLDSMLATRGQRRIFFAVDTHNHVHASLYLVWDERSAYYLIGGGDPQLRTSGAASLLMWKAICFAATVTKQFDFEGSMTESVERFFRAFGARQVPYFHISRMSRRLRVLYHGQQLVSALFKKS
jgi:hypothetical protein